MNCIMWAHRSASRKSGICLQQFRTLVGKLQGQVSEFGNANFKAVNRQLDNERPLKVSWVKKCISYRLNKLMKGSLTKRTGVRETDFSAVLRRHAVAFNLPCIFCPSRISHWTSVVLYPKNTLFLPSLASACGSIGSSKQLYIVLEIVPFFLSWLGVSDETEAIACQ